MNIYYKDGKIHVAAENYSDITNVVARVIDDTRTDFQVRLIPVILTTSDGEFTEHELTFQQVWPQGGDK